MAQLRVCFRPASVALALSYLHAGDSYQLARMIRAQTAASPAFILPKTRRQIQEFEKASGGPSKCVGVLTFLV